MTAFTVYAIFMAAVFGLTILWALGGLVVAAVVDVLKRVELQ